MNEAQPPAPQVPRCSRLAVGVLLLGVFSGPIWLGLFIMAMGCGEHWFPDASFVLTTWALGLLFVVQGAMLLASTAAWIHITRAKGVHGRGFVVIGLVAALMWTAAVWSVAMGMDF